MAGTKIFGMMEKLQGGSRRDDRCDRSGRVSTNPSFGPEWVGLYSQVRSGPKGVHVSSVLL